MSRLDELAVELMLKSRDGRWVQGIAGIPGSGKSTIAAALLDRLPGSAAVVPLDGFHYSKQALAERGRADFKGAPDTFDGGAYLALLRQLRDPQAPVRVPVYDRQLHEPVCGPTIDPSVRIIITEGNYLLLDQPPWSQLAAVLDGCWYVETPLDQARRWLIERHVAGGRRLDDAQRHYERNDLPNSHLVIARRRAPDAVLHLSAWADVAMPQKS
jgi:pantothenate kinase